MTKTTMTCPNCSSALSLRYTLMYEVWKCGHCGLEMAKDIHFDTGFSSALNEDVREDALKNLRLHNFGKIIPFIKQHFAHHKPKGIEIGCGYGWFLAASKQQDLHCVGIEPETRFNAIYQKNGDEVRNGFYPEILAPTEKYDFIIFNDVLEHIPDVNEVMQANHKHLKPEGLLIVNIPIRYGLFHCLSIVLYHIGLPSFLDRMWQFKFHSPHLYYFSRQNLIEIAAKQGLQCLEIKALKVIDTQQIQNRIGQDKSISKMKMLIMSVFIYCITPFSYLMPDIYCLFFVKKG